MAATDTGNCERSTALSQIGPEDQIRAQNKFSLSDLLTTDWVLKTRLSVDGVVK